VEVKICSKCEKTKKLDKFKSNGKITKNCNDCNLKIYNLKKEAKQQNKHYCVICMTIQNYENFHKFKNSYRHQCKKCRAKYEKINTVVAKKYRLKNKVKIAEQKKQYRLENLEYHKQMSKASHLRNRTQILMRKHKIYIINNKFLLADAKRRKKIDVRKLRDPYIRSLLKTTHDVTNPSNACIDMKRAQLEEYRLLKQIKEQ